ncbi:protein of unknown function [Pustulibacterium marinum]|uniref:LTXXQ motif family protein n=1 Tax=Pustulibacterium marinum TaxID=1224947 RepID=A0A1I7HLN1_9FLAO|nr:DUF4890 domain-containing protein [Pustulibacterium marinum]SFU61469.1 protein of unknown function [Pustulibacterium marinum]
MKKLAVLAAIFVSTMAFAQEKPQDGKMRPEHRREFADFTPEQMAELQTKRMTLALDLSEKQQKQVLKINEDKAKKHKAHFEEMKKKKEAGEERPKLTSKERFTMENARLDAQIAERKEMKSILSEEQYKKWTEMKMHRRDEMKKRFKDKDFKGKRVAHRMQKEPRD